MAADPVHDAEKASVPEQQHISELPADKTEQNGADGANGKPTEPESEKGLGQAGQDKATNNDKEKEKDDKSKGPSGGFDDTAIPSRPAGWTVKFTFHRAENLPMADINAFSSDPYLLAQLNTSTPTRHKEDPELRWRSVTIRRTTEPVWNDATWVVANVPSSGFKLKVRVYDEDPADADDRLGKIHLTVPEINEGWEGIKEEGYKLKAHDGSRRAYLLQAATTCFRRNKHFRGYLYLSVELLGRTKDDGQSGRLYTVGPGRWFRHFSPLLGRLVNIKEPDKEDRAGAASQGEESQKQKKVDTYNFQANQIQLQGPIPAKLYHRFVEFKPWVGRMFTSKGLSGVVMGKALHHQHTRVYNFGRSTVFGTFQDGPPTEEVTKQFLDLVHYDQGGRIFTYVITLDALWRFTETGKEFGIDMLSKHTMHSDVSIYIAFSGEFFIRRLKHPQRPPPPEPAESSSQSKPPQHAENEEHPPNDFPDGPPEEDPPRSPNHYELVIDNDSGTYRPNADLLPLLKSYLASQLPGLHILTLDCNKDAEKQQRMKKEQRERKKAEGDRIVYTQGSRSSSISSSDLDELDGVQAGFLDEDAIAREHGAFSQATKDAKMKNKSRVQKLRRDYGRDSHSRPEGSAIDDEGQDDASAAAQNKSKTG